MTLVPTTVGGKLIEDENPLKLSDFSRLWMMRHLGGSTNA
jgi:hypothetical protein